MATIVSKKPKLVGKREVGYGGHVKDTIGIYRYKGKLYTNSGVVYAHLHDAVKDVKEKDLIFPIPRPGGTQVWAVCRPFRGKANSKRVL